MASGLISLTIPDYVVFGTMLTLSLVIGAIYSVRDRRIRRGGAWGGAQDYLTARGQLRALPVAISSVVSWVSAISILGEPAEMYTRGTMYYTRVIAFLVGIVVAFVFVPLFYPLKLSSINEYLELRFQSRSVRQVGSVIYIITDVMYLGIVAYAPATALEAITGIPLWATILTTIMAAAVYTTLGGMRAVVWTDVLQSLFIVAGLVAIIVTACVTVGGFSEVWHINDHWGRIEFFNFNPDPTVRHTFWALMIGATIDWMGRFGISQESVQRLCALQSVRQAQWSMGFNIVISVTMATLTSLTGISIFAYYASKECDPLTVGKIKNSNQIVPFFVLDAMGFPGFPGLFLACLFSAAFSTVSSVLNGLATVTWQDFLRPRLERKLPEDRQVMFTRGLVMLYAGAGLAMAFAVRAMGGTVVQVAFSFPGASSACLLGLFLLGSLFPCANWIGALAGGTIALAVNMWISISAYSLVGPPAGLPYPSDNCSLGNDTSAFTVLLGLNQSETLAEMTTLASRPDISGIMRLFSISYLYYKPVGVLLVLMVGLLVSLITGRWVRTEVDSQYIIHLCGCRGSRRTSVIVQRGRYNFIGNSDKPPSVSSHPGQSAEHLQNIPREKRSVYKGLIGRHPQSTL